MISRNRHAHPTRHTPKPQWTTAASSRAAVNNPFKQPSMSYVADQFLGCIYRCPKISSTHSATSSDFADGDAQRSRRMPRESVPSRIARKMARPGRFERPTLCSGGTRSIQLSYGRAEKYSGNDRYSLACLTCLRQRTLRPLRPRLPVPRLQLSLSNGS